MRRRLEGLTNRESRNTRFLIISSRRKRTNGIRWASISILCLLSAGTAVAQNRKFPKPELSAEATPILWSNPTDLASRDLFYGAGGKSHEPHSTYTFEKEDLNGTSPKFDVRDESGTKWRVKLGPEARPEVVATRLLWAVGYFTNDDYFLRDLRVGNMPRLKRGQKLIAADGTLSNVRLKCYLKGEKKVATWEWRRDPFTGTRELNGLRVMMALINNWDLKTENNGIYVEKEHGGETVSLYMVSDLGSSFGTTGLSFPDRRSKGNLAAYSHSKFIKRVKGQYVDFNVPTRPNLFHLINPKEFIVRMRLRWIGHHIPRQDARWIGQILSQLSREQICQAFRAADYSPAEVEAFANVVEQRIKELNQL